MAESFQSVSCFCWKNLQLQKYSYSTTIVENQNLNPLFLIHQYDMYQNQDCLLYCAVKAKVKISSIYSLLTDNLTKTIWHGQTYK